MLLKSPAQGCQSAVYSACSNDLQHISGKHIVNSKLQEIPLPQILDIEAGEKLNNISTSLTGLAAY